MTSTMEDLARSDFDQAQQAYKDDPSQANLAAYLAATNAYEAAVRRSLPTRACYFCGKVLDARAGFIATVNVRHFDGAGYPDGEKRDYCSAECLHWQLHEDEKAES